MMKNKVTVLISIALLLGLSTSNVFAEKRHRNKTATPLIKKHQVNQQKRIAEGIATGKLNNQEAAKLLEGQAKVSNMKANAAADGKVSKKERKQIKRVQKRQSKKIYNLKHNKK